MANIIIIIIIISTTITISYPIPVDNLITQGKGLSVMLSLACIIVLANLDAFVHTDPPIPPEKIIPGFSLSIQGANFTINFQAK